MARIGTVIVPDGYLDTGPLTQSLIQDLQADMANGLSAATQGIDYGADGSLTDTTAGGLGPGWLDQLMTKGRSTITVPFNGQPIQVLGYVPLMATLANGGNFSAGTLRALGDDLSAVEQQHSLDEPLDVGDRVWASTATTRVRWNWATGGYDFPMGNDPFTSWTSAMVASPGASTTVLGTDRNLLDYLLNQRSWTVDDSPDSDDPAQQPYRTSDMQEPLQGLAAFGAALPIIIGDSASSAAAGTAFHHVVQLLGTNDTNPRIDRGNFAATDWIAPELRPGLADLLVRNVEPVHRALAHSQDKYQFTAVVADVAKGSMGDTSDSSFIVRMSGQEAQLIAERQHLGIIDDEDNDGQARVMATLAHGYTAADVGLQQRVDAEHNSMVETGTWATHLVASGLGQLPVLGSTAQFLADSLVDAGTRGLQWDNSLAAQNDAAQWTSSYSEAYVAAVRNQAYAAALDQGWLPTESGVQLTDNDGHPKLWSQFTQEEQTSLNYEWHRSLEGMTPDGLASAMNEVFTNKRTEVSDDLETIGGP